LGAANLRYAYGSQNINYRTLSPIEMKVRRMKVRRFVMEVRDNAMNAHFECGRLMPILQRMQVICTDMITGRLAPESDRIYTVHTGADIKTLRRARVYPDRVELLPDSTFLHDGFAIPCGVTHDHDFTVIGRVDAWFYDAQ